jgi:MYXO-CTERM domain-containing protein
MSISPVTGILYVTHDDPATGGFMSLYTRDLVTGAETLVGAYPADNPFVADISVAPVPEPAWTLAGAGLAGLVAVRRRKESPPRPAAR